MNAQQTTPNATPNVPAPTAAATGEREFTVTHSVRAPLALVWAAHTEPDHVRQWLLGPDGWTMPVCEIDLRVGGRYRYVWRSAEGHEMGMGGVYQEVAAPSRLVATERFDVAWYPGEGHVTMELSEAGGVTTIRHVLRYESADALQAVARSPMTDGMAATYARLGRYLAERQG